MSSVSPIFRYSPGASHRSCPWRYPRAMSSSKRVMGSCLSPAVSSIFLFSISRREGSGRFHSSSVRRSTPPPEVVKKERSARASSEGSPSSLSGRVCTGTSKKERNCVKDFWRSRFSTTNTIFRGESSKKSAASMAFAVSLEAPEMMSCRRASRSWRISRCISAPRSREGFMRIYYALRLIGHAQRHDEVEKLGKVGNAEHCRMHLIGELHLHLSSIDVREEVEEIGGT